MGGQFVKMYKTEIQNVWNLTAGILNRGEDSQLVEDGLPSFKGAHISEDVPQNLAACPAVLPHPVTPVSIGADGHDFASQFLEPAEIVRSGEKSAAPIHAAGV